MKKITFYSFLLLCVVLSSTAIAQSNDDGTTTSQVTSTTEAVIQILPERSADLLYDNGPHFNVAGTPNLSLAEDLSLGLTTRGANASVAGGFSIADDFNLATNADITNIDLYGYQTGAPTAPASIIGVFIQIWDGDPSGGGTVVWGNFIDNILNNSIWSNTYRAFESDPGSTDRAIQLVAADTPGLFLAAGDYWLDWQYVGDGINSGPWQPPVCELGVVPTGNSLQSNAGVYAPWLDGGTSDPLDAPFQIYGTPNLGVNESTLFNQVSVFPNPAQGEINISNVSSTNLEMAKIFDMRGKLIQSIDLSEMTSQMSIDVSNYATGMYMVQISTADAQITKKFMKQ